MNSAEQELEKLKKQRAELVEFLERRLGFLHEEYEQNFISMTHLIHSSSQIELIKDFIAKQGGE